VHSVVFVHFPSIVVQVEHNNIYLDLISQTLLRTEPPLLLQKAKEGANQRTAGTLRELHKHGENCRETEETGEKIEN